MRSQSARPELVSLLVGPRTLVETPASMATLQLAAVLVGVLLSVPLRVAVVRVGVLMALAPISRVEPEPWAKVMRVRTRSATEQQQVAVVVVALEV